MERPRASVSVNSIRSPVSSNGALAGLGVGGHEVSTAPEQVWGVAAFLAREPGGRPLEISVYGRDAADAQLLAKAWQALIYRDSGTSLQLTRLQQVEHEAYLTLRAGQARVRVPEVVAAGPGGLKGDALLVTAPPGGSRLGQLDGDAVPEASMAQLFTALGRLRAAGLAHGAVSGSTVIIGDTGGVALRDFRSASSGAPAGRCDADVASALVALALTAGTDRAAAAAAQHLTPAALTAALENVQPGALAAATAREARGRKGFLAELREKTAAQQESTCPNWPSRSGSAGPR